MRNSRPESTASPSQPENLGEGSEGKGSQPIVDTDEGRPRYAHPEQSATDDKEDKDRLCNAPGLLPVHKNALIKIL